MYTCTSIYNHRDICVELVEKRFGIGLGILHGLILYICRCMCVLYYLCDYLHMYMPHIYMRRTWLTPPPDCIHLYIYVLTYIYMYLHVWDYIHIHAPIVHIDLYIHKINLCSQSGGGVFFTRTCIYMCISCVWLYTCWCAGLDKLHRPIVHICLCHVHIHIHKHVFMYMYVYVCVDVCVYDSYDTYTYMYINICLCICMCMFMYMYVCMIHTTHTHTYT